MRKYIIAFIHCGIIGWCLEILFTTLQALRRREKQVYGRTSVLMFPIYGMAVFLFPLWHLIRRFPTILRGLIYMSCIFAVEYNSGRYLLKHHVCPWNYEKSRFHIGRVIRLDYAPFWFLTGLLFEKYLKHDLADTKSRPFS